MRHVRKLTEEACLVVGPKTQRTSNLFEFIVDCRENAERFDARMSEALCVCLDLNSLREALMKERRPLVRTTLYATLVVASLSTLVVACSGGEKKSDEKPVELPEYDPLEDLPAGTRAVLRVDPARLESLQATIMERFDGNAPMPADLDVALATTSAAIIYPPQPTRLFSSSPGRDPLPSLDRTRPIYHALTTEPALGFVDALRVGKTPATEPSLGARLYLPATDAESLAREFGFFCEDGRNQSMTNGCTTVAQHTAKNGWIVVELDYGGQPARVRTTGSTGWARMTPAVDTFVGGDASLALWFDTTGVAEIAAVMTWQDATLMGATLDDSEVSPFEKTLDAMAPVLRSDPSARETEDITFALQVEGKDIAIDAVRTLTQRGLTRADAGETTVAPRSVDVKNPLVELQFPWSTAGIRSATEPPQWAVDEAEIGRIGSGQWRQAVPWLEAPFAYYIGLAWGPRPVRSAGWLRSFFSLDAARLRLDARADDESPVGFAVDGGAAVVPADDGALSALSNVLELYTSRAAALLQTTHDYVASKEGEHHHVVTTLGSARATDPTEVGEVVFAADLTRAADLLEASGNTELVGPQLTTVLRAARALELTYDRQGAAEAWRLHIGHDDVASASASTTEVSALLLEPLDICVIEARKRAAQSMRARLRGKDAAAVDYDDIASRCTTDEGRRLVSN